MYSDNSCMLIEINISIVEIFKEKVWNANIILYAYCAAKLSKKRSVKNKN